MKLDAQIAGVGMTRFSKFLDRGLKSTGPIGRVARKYR
jgi:hypothetical protein